MVLVVVVGGPVLASQSVQRSELLWLLSLQTGQLHTVRTDWVLTGYVVLGVNTAQHYWLAGYSASQQEQYPSQCQPLLVRDGREMTLLLSVCRY